VHAATVRAASTAATARFEKPFIVHIPNRSHKRLRLSLKMAAKGAVRKDSRHARTIALPDKIPTECDPVHNTRRGTVVHDR
jgi:hypothetical protein